MDKMDKMDKSTTTQEHTKQEHKSLWFGIMAVVLICVMGSPCCCYTGAGFYTGFSQFTSGVYKNPARQVKRRTLRDPKYNPQHHPEYTKPAKPAPKVR